MAVNSYVVRSGELRRRITFQTRQTTQDAAGQAVETWVPAFTAWADITPLTGRELMAAQAVQSSVSHMITMRYRSEFANPTQVANMRAVYNGRLFNIHASLNQDERNRSVMLQAEEGLNAG